MKVSGNILKMKSRLEKPVEYFLPVADQLIPMNAYLGKKIKMSFDGQINCIATGEKIKKSYNQGYSYKSFMTLAECDICIVKPELCHYDKGTCRDPKWGEDNCLKPHVLYLAVSSGLKVGITREKQVPTRWIDQGATYVLPILQMPGRKEAGLLEDEMKAQLDDKTNWRKMLSNEVEQGHDLKSIAEGLFDSYADLIDDLGGEDLDAQPLEIHYPVLEYPTKIKSLGFDKNPIVEGTLQGIKGQYLILDTGVINMRKHQGYFLEIELI